MAHLNYTVGGDSNFVSFKSAARVPIDSLKVHFKPIQDLRGYDHPWPAGGGKNLLQYPSIDNGWVKGFLSNDTGSIAGQSVALEMTTDYIPITSGAQYTFSFALSTLPEGGAYWLGYLFFDSEKAPVGTRGTRWSETKALMSAPEGASFVRISLRTYGVALWVQLESGSTATSYSPYSNICPISGWTGCEVKYSGADTSDPATLPVTFPSSAGAVYGGYVDLVNGKLVADKYSVDPTAWARYNASNGYVAYRAGNLPYGKHYSEVANGAISNVISNFGTFESSNMDKNIIQCPNTEHANAYLALQEDLDPAALGLQLVYPMRDPITYDIDPTELKTLLSTNNIWSNTNDVTEVSYAIHDSAMIRAAKRRMAMMVSHKRGGN